MSFVPSSNNVQVVSIEPRLRAPVDATGIHNEKLSKVTKSSCVDWIDEDAPVYLLQPDESFAFSFMLSNFVEDVATKPLGHPLVKWCTSMGEFSFYRGDDAHFKSSAISQANHHQIISSAAFPLKTHCLSCPAKVCVNDRFTVSLRVTNTGSTMISARLHCHNTPSSASGARGGVTSSHFSQGGSLSHAATPTSYLQHSQRQAIMPGGAGSAGIQFSSSGNVMVSVGLCVTGITHFHLGNIETSHYIDVTLSVFALAPGLHELEGLYLVDNATNVEYCCSVAQKIYVCDSEP
jgi:hypothetical protein